jgi:hypothetical protein
MRAAIQVILAERDSFACGPKAGRQYRARCGTQGFAALIEELGSAVDGRFVSEFEPLSAYHT